MNQKVLFLIILSTFLPHIIYSMEITRSKKKKLHLAIPISIPKNLTTPKPSNSHEAYLLYKNIDDQRQISRTDEEAFNSLITFDSKNINKTYAHNETILIWACRNNKTSVIKHLLINDNILINQKDMYNQTALHYCAQHKNEEVIKILLRNPQTDASITNSYNQTAREKINGFSEQDTKLRRIIFARIMLDVTVKNICTSLQDEYPNAFDATATDTDKNKKRIIEIALEEVKKILLKDQENQQEENRNLPESAKLPDYADDDFIRQMIALRIIEGND